jgi:hypothetical protein
MADKEQLLKHRESMLQEAEALLAKYREICGMLSYNQMLLESAEKEEGDGTPDQPAAEV